MKKGLLGGLAGLATMASAGCSGITSAPAGKGNDVIVDVPPDKTMEEMAEGSTPYLYSADGASLAPSDAGIFGTLADAYAVPSVCATQCVCGAGTFCFGGAAGSPPFSGACNNTSGYGVGCDPLPPGATTCATLLPALSGKLSCTPRCISANGLTVTCD